MVENTCPNDDQPPGGAQYGERCLPNVLDHVATTDPDRLYAMIPKSMELSEGFKNITFREMAHCVNYFAHLLEEAMGRGVDSETIAFLGVPDLRNAICFLAAVKCGYKLLFLSPRNQMPTNASLLAQTNCKTILYSGEMVTSVTKLQAEMKDLKGIQAISIEEMLQHKTKKYLYHGEFAKVMRDPILVLHSSGSTGTPKPITMTHGTFSTFDYCRKLPHIHGRKNNDFTLWDSKVGRKFYSAFPPSHLAGFLSMIIVPIFSEASSPVLGPSLRPPSGQLVKEIMEQQQLRCLFIPPAVAEQILQEPDGLDFFRGLDFMYYAGGPLSQSAGDIISRVTTLCQLYGSTESSQIPQLVPLPEDWAYMEWHPIVKFDMRADDSEDGAHELVLYMDSSTEKFTALNYNAPGANEWQTRDLFIPHPSKPNLWRFHGRKDDIIVLSNSEKIFPVPMEIMMSGHPLLSGALVVGQGRFQAALLVEPKSDAPDEAILIAQIWPLVEKANHLMPGQGRITRSNILVSKTDKPFQRAAKGTIIRRLTEQAYGLEISALYLVDRADNHSDSLPILEAASEVVAVEDFVRSIVTMVFENITTASNDDDMYVLGLDSLKTLEIIGLLKTALRKSNKRLGLQWLSSRTIYSYPTIRQLAIIIAESLTSDALTAKTDNKHLEKQREVHMKRLIERYTQGLEQRLPTQQLDPEARGITVAVTGTTGSLGTRIVQTLVRSPQVVKIYCLDRSQDAEQKHAHKGILFDRSKVRYIAAMLSRPHLGISDAVFTELTTQVDVIIHNAWKVDFSQILESFEHDHIRGTRALIDWSNNSPKRPRLVFISSISAVSNLTETSQSFHVPELVASSLDAPAHTGYGESKYVAENILALASKQSKTPISILRVGQVAGSTELSDPEWPVQEWVPSLVKTAKSSGLIPYDLPPVDWIPINKLAIIIIELMLNDLKTDNLQCYNLLNPHSTPWNSIVDTIQHYCGPQTRLIPLAAWLAGLQELQIRENRDEFIAKPALKMLDFFSQMLDRKTLPPQYQTSRSVQMSPTMASLEPVNKEWMQIWLAQWAF